VSEARTSRAAPLRRLLPPALLTLLATDLVGGVLDVRSGRSSLASAWSSSATLCAPWPMIAFQVAAFVMVRRGHGRPRRVAAVLLALACGVSVLSGFFDGQLGRADLTAGERGFQVWLLAVTGVLGLAAAAAALGDDRR
jgi:hypothetical protein